MKCGTGIETEHCTSSWKIRHSLKEEVTFAVSLEDLVRFGKGKGQHSDFKKRYRG